MKLLMLTHRFPYPPDRGDRIRAWGELDYLARRHDVWLACLERSAPWPAHLQEARRRCRAVAVCVRSNLAALLRGGRSLAAGRSLSAGYFADARLAEMVRCWSRSVGFDAVLTFSSAMAPYAQLLEAPRRVLDMNDVDSSKWRAYARRALPPLRWLYALEARRLAALEGRCARQHDLVLLVNERERHKLQELAPAARSAVVRTGVDLARYPWAAGPQAAPLPKKPIVGMLGSMSYPPNVRAVSWFHRHVWPLVRRARPDARWLIVGSRPTRLVRRAHRPPYVLVTGYVPDVRTYLRALRVFVDPVDEQIGVQTKLIEAMAAGKPAVVSPASAAGIDHGGRPPFLLAEEPEQFARCVLRLLEDDRLARRLGARARRLVEQGYRVDQQVRLVERWLQGHGLPGPERSATGRAKPAEWVAV